jgi:secreted trypsin-like serine protease
MTLKSKAAIFGLFLFISSSSFGIEGGIEVGSNQDIAKSTVALNIMFVGFSKNPMTPDPNKINPCGATIYDNDLVITAAHCVKDLSAFHLIFSTNPYDSNATRRSVVAFEIPMDYVYTGDTDKTAHSDIALLYFKGGLPTGYQKAKFIQNVAGISLDTPVNAAGFGPCESVTSCQLSQANATVATLKYLPDDLGLAFSNGAKAVKGDSGGPAFLNTSAGSYVFGVCHGDWSFDGQSAEFYTSLSNQMAWLAQAATRLRNTAISHGPGWGDSSGPSPDCPNGTCPPLVQVPIPGTP